MNTYRVLDRNACHIDVSRTEKGAKRYATLHGYKTVSIRYNCGYDVDIIAEKRPSGKWAKHGTQVRETVYKVMLGNCCINTFSGELAAYAYMNHTQRIYTTPLIVKRGWKLIEY